MPRTSPEPVRPFRLDFTPLASRRRSLFISQVDLAAAAGVHWHTILRTEKNRTNPTVEQLVAIARALGTPMYSLFAVVDE